MTIEITDPTREYTEEEKRYVELCWRLKLLTDEYQDLGKEKIQAALNSHVFDVLNGSDSRTYKNWAGMFLAMSGMDLHRVAEICGPESA